MTASRQSEATLRQHALTIFQASLEAAEAGQAVRSVLAVSRDILRVGKLRLLRKEYDRIFLIAVGKAAVPMAQAIEETIGERLEEGLAVTKHGHAAQSLKKCRIIQAGHPIPDEAGFEASQEVERLLRQLNARDLLIVAISGGASALLSAPAAGVTLAAKQKATDLLLRAGADIGELNAVRKHLSRLKGGRLAQLAYPAAIVSLILSDVIGDPLDVIGSGPTAPDDSSFADALAVIGKFNLLNRIPQAIRRLLEDGKRGLVPETPKGNDPLFDRVHNVVIGSNRLALQAAARTARKLGYRTLILASSMRGETRDVADAHAQILHEVTASRQPIARPACLLSGGETTVTVRGAGKGGRNQEFVLAAALPIAGLRNVLVLSAGTDGTDGPTDAAGAIATGRTVERALAKNLDPANYLVSNNSYPFFEALGDLVKTGPTGTNVMDIHLLLAG